MLDTENPHIEHLIVTRLLCRGEGTEDNPMRRVTQIFREDGSLLAERDPHHEILLEKLLKKPVDEIPY